jgi:hypothetical protein
MRSNRELVWCILSDFDFLGAGAALVLLSTSSAACASWPSMGDREMGEEPRRVVMEARGVRDEGRSDCGSDGGALVVLPLEWEGVRPSSLLPFLSSGKREKVKRRLWTLGRAARAGAGVRTGVLVDRGSGAVEAAGVEAKGSVCCCSCVCCSWVVPVLRGRASAKTAVGGGVGEDEAGAEAEAEAEAETGLVVVFKGMAVQGMDDHGEWLPGLAVRSATLSCWGPSAAQTTPPKKAAGP